MFTKLKLEVKLPYICTESNLTSSKTFRDIFLKSFVIIWESYCLSKRKFIFIKVRFNLSSIKIYHRYIKKTYWKYIFKFYLIIVSISLAQVKPQSSVTITTISASFGDLFQKFTCNIFDVPETVLFNTLFTKIWNS